MNKKLLQFLKGKCKDMGLTEKAITDLATAGSDGLTDESSDEDIESAANRVIPFAKAMQGEATRWAQSKKQTEEEKPGEKGGSSGGQGGKFEFPEELKTWQKGIEKQVTDLQSENTQLKAEKAKNERSSSIATKAKELGIPDYLMKRFHIAEDADFEKELTDYKQDLVTNKLMPEDATGVKSSSDEAQKQIANSLLEEIIVETKSE